MIPRRNIVVASTAISTLLANQTMAQEAPPVLTAADRKKLRVLLARQARAEARTPAIINQLREQLRNGAQQG